MNLAPIVGLCAVLAVLLLLLWRRSTQEEADWSSEAAHRPEIPVRLPDRTILERCLSSEDLEFISSFESQALLRLFMRERRRLAVAWLRQTRWEARRLLRLHVSSVRYAADLRPGAEAKLFLAAGLFLLVYGAMLGIVSWYGPLRTRRFLKTVQVLAAILSQLGERIATATPSAALTAANA